MAARIKDSVAEEVRKAFDWIHKSQNRALKYLIKKKKGSAKEISGYLRCDETNAYVILESLVDMGLIKDVRVQGNQVWVKMTVTSPFCPMMGYMKDDVRRTVEELDGIENVDVEMIVPEF